MMEFVLIVASAITANKKEVIGLIPTLSTAITALVAVIALFFTAWDSRNRSKPEVIAYFDYPEHSHASIFLVIHNVGASVAKNVTVEFDKELGVNKNNVVERYDKPIFSMSPDQRFRNVWYTRSMSRISGNKFDEYNHHDLPENIGVTIKYNGRFGQLFKIKRKFVLDRKSVKATYD